MGVGLGEGGGGGARERVLVWVWELLGVGWLGCDLGSGCEVVGVVEGEDVGVECVLFGVVVCVRVSLCVWVLVCWRGSVWLCVVYCVVCGG